MRTDLFDFELPEELIALYPASPRDSAKMLVVRPGLGPDAGLHDCGVRELAQILRPGDALVFNDTKVIPAALAGLRYRDGSASGGAGARISFNLHKRLDESRWKAFARPLKRLKVGDRIQFGGDGGLCYGDCLDAQIEAKGDAGEVTLAFSTHGAHLDQAIAAKGSMPLPPYIASKRAAGDQDAADYQTIYARHDGAVAAPTAGLHFTEALMQALGARGISKHFLTLHVGAGTFLPVKAEETQDHVMHEEWGEISPQVAQDLNAVRAKGGRIIAVGTTALRLLETAAVGEGQIEPFAGDTNIFITPGYRFRGVDLLLTNFHLPRSTLFMLVSAFAGLEVMQGAYAHAIGKGYRFYSYGDACLLFPQVEAASQEPALQEQARGTP